MAILHPTHPLILYSHWTGGWVKPRLSLYAPGNRSVSSSGEISNSDPSIVQRIASHYIDWAVWFLNTPIDSDVHVKWDVEEKVYYRSVVDHFLSFVARQSLLGKGLHIVEASRSPSDTPNSVGFLWTSDQADVKTSTWQHTLLTRGRHPCTRRDSNPQSQPASGRVPMP